MIRTGPLMRAGRDAVVDAWISNAPPPKCPYAPRTKSRLFWQLGADRATAVVQQLERIG